MALFEPYKLLGDGRYAVLENERDIPSSGNTYQIGTGPRPGFGTTPQQITGGTIPGYNSPWRQPGDFSMDVRSYRDPVTGYIHYENGLEPTPPPEGWTPGTPEAGSPFFKAGPDGSPVPARIPVSSGMFGSPSGAPAATSYWEGNTLVNPTAAQPLMQPSGYNYGTGGAPVPWGYGSSAADQPEIESEADAQAKAAANAGGGGGGFFDNPTVANTLAVAPTVLGIANKFGMLDPIKAGVKSAWNEAGLPTWGSDAASAAASAAPGLFALPEGAVALSPATEAALLKSGWLGNNAALPGTGLYPPPVGSAVLSPSAEMAAINSGWAANPATMTPGTWSSFTGGLGAVGAPFMGAVAAKVAQGFLGLDGRGGILHTLGLIDDERDAEALARSAQTEEGINAIARRMRAGEEITPEQLGLMVGDFMPSLDNPANQSRLADVAELPEWQTTGTGRVRNPTVEEVTLAQAASGIKGVSELDQEMRKRNIDDPYQVQAAEAVQQRLWEAAGLGSRAEYDDLYNMSQGATQSMRQGGQASDYAIQQAQQAYARGGKAKQAYDLFLPPDLLAQVRPARAGQNYGDGMV